MSLRLSDLEKPSELTPEKLEALLWDPTTMKGGYVTATLRRSEYTRWSGRIDQQSTDTAFGLAMPYLAGGMLVFEELDQLEVVHCADNTPLPWKVGMVHNFRQDIDKGEIVVTASVTPAFNALLPPLNGLRAPVQLTGRAHFLEFDPDADDHEPVIGSGAGEVLIDDDEGNMIHLVESDGAMRIAAAQVPLSPKFQQFVQSQVNSIFGSGNALHVSFTPVNAPTINFRLAPETHWATQVELFLRWLADTPRHSPGAYITGEEAVRFFDEFVRAAMRVKTQAGTGIEARTKRALARIGPMVALAADMRMVETAIDEELTGVALDVCMNGPDERAMSSSKDKALLMRTAAANVIQERIDVQQSYANRSPEHKTRMEIYQSMKQKIEAIDPGGLE